MRERVFVAWWFISGKNAQSLGALRAVTQVFFKLHEMDNPGAFEDWDVYIFAAINAARSVWDVLHKFDRKRSDLAGIIFEEYNNWAKDDLIRRNFIRGQRNRLLHHWAWDIVPLEVSTRKWLGGEYLGKYIKLVFDYPNPEKPTVDVPEELQGEDPLRLLGIALSFLHEDLSKIEIALSGQIENPFSGGVSEQDYANSEFFRNAPSFYR